MIGINNRDLTTLEVDTRRTFELLPRVAGHALVVAESGFSRRDQLDELAAAGVDAVLIGEALMRVARHRGRMPRSGGALRRRRQAPPTIPISPGALRLSL